MDAYLTLRISQMRLDLKCRGQFEMHATKTLRVRSGCDVIIGPQQMQTQSLSFKNIKNMKFGILLK